MKPEFENIALIDNKELQRFELPFMGHIAFIEYHEEEGALSLPNTFAPDELRGTGAASALVEKTFTELRKRKVKIRPYCPYLQMKIKRYPEWKALVDPLFDNYKNL